MHYGFADKKHINDWRGGLHVVSLVLCRLDEHNFFFSL